MSDIEPITDDGEPADRPTRHVVGDTVADTENDDVGARTPAHDTRRGGAGDRVGQLADGDAHASDDDIDAHGDGGDDQTDGGDDQTDGGATVDEADGADEVRFADLGLSDEILTALADAGYEHPTPIQSESIPPLLDGFDLLGQAATGTGKTAAFALPMLDRVAGVGRSKIPFGLVLVPTRELANQVAEATQRYGARRDVRIAALYGGTAIGPQFARLNAGVDIVVGTPGRVLDHLQRGSLDLSGCGMVVLDEADEMLDMGFAEDLEAILDAAPPERQTVLFSATMPNRIDSIARRQLTNPVRISIERPADTDGERPLVRQTAYLCPRTHRAAALARVLDMESPDAAIVFCRTRGDVEQLVDVMNGRGHRAEALHGGMSQDQRDRAMGRLKSGLAGLLVATDVAARGIDVDHLSHVVNFDVPRTSEAYTHRIGRVGRAGRRGVAITLGGPKDRRRIDDIARRTGFEISIEKIPTVDELRAKRIEATRADVAARITPIRPTGLADDGDRESAYRTVVESLAADHDPFDVAVAAVRLAHEASGRTNVEEEIPDVSTRPDPARRERGDRRASHEPRGPRGADRHGPKDRDDRPFRNADGSHHVETGFVSLQFNLGRSAGVRPGDLVGAIANEADMRGSEIGAIKINDRSAFVQVPERHARKVLRSMDGAKIRNKPVRVRRANNT